MDEITTWFENRFGHLGFYVTPTIYNPDDFSPARGVLFNNDRTTFKTQIVLRDIFLDVHSDYTVPLEVYKELITDVVTDFLQQQGLNPDGSKKSVEPKQYIKKHNFKIK